MPSHKHSDKQEVVIAQHTEASRLPGEKPADELSGWHYATIRYLNRDLGLLVETDDQATALREAWDVCKIFGRAAKVIDVKKVTIQ
jgi:hypothetical protein